MTQPIICARCKQPMKRGEYKRIREFYGEARIGGKMEHHIIIHRSPARCQAGSKAP